MCIDLTSVKCVISAPPTLKSGTNQPMSQVNDSIQLDLATNKVQDIIVFEVGNLCMVTGGANAGRVGTMISRYFLESLI